MKVTAIGGAAMVALSAMGAARAQDKDMLEGEQLYVSQCKVCHGNNAGEKLGQQAPVPPHWRLAHAGAGSPVGATRSDAGERLVFAPPFGPNLRGIVGRPAGTYPGYDYSASFLKALTGMTWTEGTLDWWIRDTQAWVPGTTMFYKQKDAEVRRKIILYLQANR